MNTRTLERALARLAGAGAVLAPARESGFYCVYPSGDRRRRPLARLSAEVVRALVSDGALDDAGEGAYVLSEAGRMRVRREGALPGEGYSAQHAPIIDRIVMARGEEKSLRGFESGVALRRLAALRDANGKAWLNSAELAAAAALREDWESAQAGLARGSDWRAPPNGSTARASNGVEAAMAARCDARRRFADRLHALAPALRRVVERVVLYDDGVEALERAEGWPSRSGKVALKLGLAQLALDQAAARASS